MVRISKQAERRSVSRRRPKPAGPKTGTKKDNLPQGFKAHPNAVEEASARATYFIPRIK